MREYFSGLGDCFFRLGAGSASKSSKDLDGGTRQNTKHEVAHHFECSANSDVVSTEVVFELGVDAFGGGTLFETLSLGRIERDFFLTSGVGVNDGNMSKAGDEITDLDGVIGGIGKFVENGVQALRAHLSQRNGDLGIMNRSGSEDGADGNISINYIQMKFASAPSVFEAFGIFLTPMVASIGQVDDVFFQGTVGLEIEAFWSGGWNDFSLLGTTPFAFGLFGSGVLRFGSGFFPDFNGGGISTEVKVDLRSEIGFDQDLMDTLWEMEECKISESPAESGFGGDLTGEIPSADATEGMVAFEKIDQSVGGGNIPNGFCDKSFCHGKTIGRFGADEFPSERSHEVFELGEFENQDQIFLVLGERADMFTDKGEKFLELEARLEGCGGGHKNFSKKVLHS